MNQRALLVFLALCICASILYISMVYLNNERRGRKVTVYSINVAEANKIAKFWSDCISGKNANCQDVDLTKFSHTWIEELEQMQRFHPNYDTFPSIRPITRTTDAHAVAVDITMAPTRVVPTSITNLGRKIPFDPYGTDTMVYMHIQKTGGSEFLEHLVTAQIPLESIKISNDSRKSLWPTPKPNSQFIPLCQTSPTGGWRRGGGYLGNGTTMIIHHELCPRNWKDPKGETWLVSEKTTAWTCGVHAFYTDFKKCLQNSTIFNYHTQKKVTSPDELMRLSQHNHFHYVVILRHPFLRYVSEYLHVSRGACWARKDKCSKKVAIRRQFRCPEDFQCRKDIVKKFSANLTLAKFLRCTESQSINRMTVSLADHKLATCWDKKKYSRKQRDQTLIESAKSNLRNISYFGLNEFIEESGLLFEKTFGLVLKNPIQGQSPNSSKAGQFISTLIQEKEFKRVVKNNLLDLELYEYALDLFRIRMRTIGKELDTDTLNYILTLNDAMHKVQL